jgi:MFS superfamily sulfate permease-like transporter
VAAVLDLESTYEIDTTGTDALLQVKQTLDDRGIRLLVARPRASVRDFLDRTGAAERIRSENVYATVAAAVAAATVRTADNG